MKHISFSCVLLALVFSPAFAVAAEHPTAAAPIVLCSLDVPTVSEDGAVTVRVWAVSSASVSHTWKATAGSISGGSEARWSLAGVAPGIYRATVYVRGPDLDQACSVRLVVTDRQRGRTPPIETGKAFLATGEKETAGYGLYSYLLMGAPPIESTRDRYLKVIDAYLKLIPSVEKLKQNIRAQEINATYVPVDAKVPDNVSAAWILEHYDYARARALLRLIPGNLREGPYFVSTLAPLTGATQMTDQYLFQNLSAVPTAPDDLASWWVREFMNQAAQERFWDSNTAAQFALKLRTTIGIVSVGLPDVRRSLSEWISWKR